MKKQLVLVVLVLFLASLACNLGSGTTNGGDSSASSKNVLFKDDFSDTGSGWDTTTTDNVGREYTSDGKYRLLIKTIGDGGKGFEGWSVAGLNLSGDIRIEVEAAKAGGSDNNYFGILCRYTDENNYYYFEASSDGYAIIGKNEDGNDQFISSDKMQFTDAIKQGEATNRLRADCIGNTLTLYVNGQQAAEATDNSFDSGDIGLIAGTIDEPNTEILFDNVLVTKP